MEGHYSVFLDGTKICESKNIITTIGKDTIRKFLVGDYPSWAAALGVGSGGSGSPSAGDTKLTFEVDREPIFLKTMITPRHYISSIVISNGTTIVFQLLEYPKIAIGDSISVFGTTVSGISVNGTHTVTDVNNSSKTVTVGGKSGLTNGTYSQESQAGPYLEGPDSILLKAKFSDELVMTINEVGVFSTYETRYDSGYNVGMISDFSESGWGSYGSSSALVGHKTVNCTSTARTLTNMSFSMDSYTTGDKIYLLLNNKSNTKKTVTVTLYSSPTVYKSFTFSETTPSTGSQVVYATIDSLPLSTVSYMTVKLASIDTGSVDLDALSVVNFDQFGYPDKLVSRSILPTAIVKTAGQQLEVEYSMRID